MTHGSYVHILPLYDPDGFFPILGRKVFAHSDETYDAIIHAVIVGEIYEIVGKIRNITSQPISTLPPMLPFYTVSLTRYSAWLVGLANRHLYTSTSVMLAESLALLDCPTGYVALCRLVMSGNLADPVGLLTVVEVFWAGVEEWASKRGIRIEQSLEELLN
jgi:kanamycin nucleotidyltransferase